MTEEKKRFFNLYRYLWFPVGPIVLTPIWFSIIIKAIDPFLKELQFVTNNGDTVGVPWWCSWVLFAIGVIVIFVITAHYTYSLPKGKKRGHNIFVLITSEQFEDDKYITGDFIENFKHHIAGSIENLNIVVPSRIKRDTFNQTIESYTHRNKNFWESKQWGNLHKRMKGVLYISGILKRRTAEGKEKYVFCLSSTIGYNDVNKAITPLMKKELQMNFPQRIIINKEFELEGFDDASNRFATYSEYVIGWAHLVSGYVGEAYKMHFDIFSNNKQSFFQRGGLKNLKSLIEFELNTIISDCKLHPKDFVCDCVKTTEKLFSDSDSSILSLARYWVMSSTDYTFDDNLLRAERRLKRIKLNNRNRSATLGSRAYICLLKGDYSNAESNYRLFFKNADPALIDGIIRYCDSQTKSGCLKEKPTAFYVKALMLRHTQTKGSELKRAIGQARKNIPDTYIYYHGRLAEMSDNENSKKDGTMKK